MNKQLSKQKEISKFADTFNRRRKLKNINKIDKYESDASIV